MNFATSSKYINLSHQFLTFCSYTILPIHCRLCCPLAPTCWLSRHESLSCFGVAGERRQRFPSAAKARPTWRWSRDQWRWWPLLSRVLQMTHPWEEMGVGFRLWANGIGGHHHRQSFKWHISGKRREWGLDYGPMALVAIVVARPLNDNSLGKDEMGFRWSRN